MMGMTLLARMTMNDRIGRDQSEQLLGALPIVNAAEFAQRSHLYIAPESLVELKILGSRPFESLSFECGPEGGGASIRALSLKFV